MVAGVGALRGRRKVVAGSGLQRKLDAKASDYAEEFPLAEKVLDMFGPPTPEEKHRRGTEWLSAFRILVAVGEAPDPKEPRDVAAGRELGNWLARVNLNARGGAESPSPLQHH